MPGTISRAAGEGTAARLWGRIAGMASASASTTDPSTRVAFQLERLEADADGRLEVVGTWSGVRGIRFVRPALVVRTDDGERTLLAVLEHKPWDPEGSPWRAAFPWDGGGLDPERVQLALYP